MNDENELDRAVLVLTGQGTIPHRDFGALEAAFGADAAELEREVRVVLATLDAFEPDWDSVDLPEATSQARDFVANRHPALGDTALDALAWLFSFEMR